MNSILKEQKINPDPGVVLVVEDNDSLRKLIIKLLEINGFKTRDAENGLVAKTIFDLNQTEVRLIISDMRMPVLDGIGLLKHVRQVSQVPFIAMTGFSDVLTVQDAYSLGAREFLAKPVETDTLLDAVRRSLNPDSNLSDETQSGCLSAEVARYCPIQVDEFITSSRLQSDIYVKLSEKKYVKIAHLGEDVPVDRLRIYKEKKIDYLYVKLEEFGQYVDFNLRLTSVAVLSSNVSKKQKLNLMRHTTEILVEQCFLGQIDAEFVRPAQKMVEDSIALSSNDPDCLGAFLAMNDLNRLYAHSVAVSVYSCMVARLNGWDSATTLFKVAIAGLLHDIGMKEVPVDILEKNRLERTAGETKLLETHPIRSRDIILQLKALPEDVAQIAYQHHETPLGTGYPYCTSGDQIHPLARLIGTVDHFVELVMPIMENAVPLSPQQALSRIQRFDHDQVDLTFLRRLMTLFNCDEKTQELT